MRRSGPSIIGLAVLLLGAPGCDARRAPAPAADRGAYPTPTLAAVVARAEPSYRVDVAPVIARHCLACHDAATREGGIALDHFEADAPHRDDWDRVAAVLESGTMPPSGRARPAPAEVAAVADWLAAEVARRPRSDVHPRRATMRRLTRSEYNNTIRDLIGLDLRPADAFPPDDEGYGFDEVGAVLSVPPLLAEKYLQAAHRTLEAARRSPAAWARIMNPGPDRVPPAHRKFVPPVRTEPVKRIGRPAFVTPAPAAEDREGLALRRAREVIRAFADRAYRRPVTADELDRLVGLVEAARRDGDDPEAAICYALEAVLVAPSFLFLVEEGSGPSPPAGEAGQPLGDFELAARLSYFLWNSIPDAALYEAAAAGDLRRGDHLAEQVGRMLRDAKACSLADDFAGQWLQVRALRDVTPDPGRYPNFDEPLRRAMIEETLRFAAAIFRDDRSLLDFLDADSTFVNERLARHYGIPDVVGDQFRRVVLPDGRRGGVLTQASVLTVTSNPTRTSPVKRGKWVLDNLLGMPPAPPPAGVEALGDGGGAERPATLRQQLERHRDDPRCASCHARMDPLGFGLENFDGIGAWRATEGGAPLDASGSLPDGTSFAGPAGLRAVLVARRGQFLRCFAEKLLIYALGRGLTPADRGLVARMVRQAERDGYRPASMIQVIVASPAFQNLQ